MRLKETSCLAGRRLLLVHLTIFSLLFWKGSTHVDVNEHSPGHRFRSATPLGRASPKSRGGELTSVSSNTTTVFEVDRPVQVPTKRATCTMTLLEHDFGNHFGAPTLVPYTPDPGRCGSQWSTVVMKWNTRVTGVQFDRIIGVWLSGVEILRSSTAEPVGTGHIIEWEVEKNITQYSALLRQNQTLAVSLENLVNDEYTGIYNTTITATFYEDTSVGSKPENDTVILPISNPSPFNGSYWFTIENETDVHSRSLAIPRNTYEAFVEIYVSFHGDDEFWYTTASPFREVVLSIDDKEVGAVWPAPVLFTGAFEPALWTPVVGIGAFKLPTYLIDITPFVGELVDGREHKFSIKVVNSMDFWLVDANLFLKIDTGSTQTTGGLTKYSAPAYNQTVNSTSDGSVMTQAARSINFAGYVNSSSGNRTISVNQSLNYQQIMEQGVSFNQLTTKVLRTLVTDTVGGELIMDSVHVSEYPFNFTDSIAAFQRSFIESEVAKFGGKFANLNYSVYLEDTQNAQSTEPAMYQNYRYVSTADGCYNRELQLEQLSGIFAFDRSNTTCTALPSNVT